MMINYKLWEEIPSPEDTNNYKGKRVDPSHPFNFYYGKDFKGNYTFLLMIDTNIDITLPSLMGIDIFVSKNEAERKLVFCLLDGKNLDIFTHFCADILEHTTNAKNNNELFKIINSRLVSWQSIFKNKKMPLDDKAQRGLIGELLFMQDFLLNKKTPSQNISSWQGIDSNLHDFIIDDKLFEVKTITDRSDNIIIISSVEQIQINPNLYICAVKMNSADKKSPKSFCLNSLVEDIYEKIKSLDEISAERFMNKLKGFGYHREYTYNQYFIVNGMEFFRVDEGFPCLDLNNLAKAITKLTYGIDLNYCQSFKVNENDIF